MPVKNRALIIGGSVGGLLAAGMLRGRGWETALFERSNNVLDGRGAGIGVTEELLELVGRKQTAGVTPLPAHAVTKKLDSGAVIARAARRADLVLAAGSTLEVQPAADVPLAAEVVERGATVREPRGEILDEENVRERLAMRRV